TNDRAIDIISAGYPCQPFSNAGKRRGTEDDRHLWPEVKRLLEEIRPRWFLGENVAGHITLGLDIVLSDLESIGYTAQPVVIPACAVGAPHRRDRVFILGYSEQSSRSGSNEDVANTQSDITWRLSIRTWPENSRSSCSSENVANATVEGFSQRRQSRLTPPGTETESRMEPESKRCCETLANTQSIRRDYGNDGENERTSNREINTFANTSLSSIKVMANTSSPGQQKLHSTSITGRTGHSSGGANKRGAEWTTQSGLGGVLNGLSTWLDGYRWPAALGQPQHDWEPPRVATGVKDRVGRLKALGNAVNPVQVYPILAAIKAIDMVVREGRA
ncbi:DNA cytosine methyltransferase, partial [Paenibacillus alvei]